MARIILHGDTSLGLGSSFTAEAIALDDETYHAPMTVKILGAEQFNGDVVTRASTDSSGIQYRLAGYRRNSEIQEGRSATDWWEVKAYFDANGEVALIGRDTLTGTLMVDESFLSPTGTVSGVTCYQGYNSDRTSLQPIYSALGGAWDAAELLKTSGLARHAILSAGNDVLSGSDFDDQIETGAGIDDITGGGGADLFLVARGAGAKWVKGEHSDLGVLINSKTKRYGSKRNKLVNAYDSDVDIILDFTKGVDILSLQGDPSRYSFEDNGESTLIFSGSSRRNLVAVVSGVPGLDRRDVESWG
jgi:Ca2+-binding RTX toxin-like protein